MTIEEVIEIKEQTAKKLLAMPFSKRKQLLKETSDEMEAIIAEIRKQKKGLTDAS